MNQTLFDKLSEPVQELFLLGEDAARGKKCRKYLAYGITSEHIPELLRVIHQIQSFWYDDQGFTPVQAWSALGQLKAKKAINSLIFLIHQNEELDADWIGEEIPVVKGMIGPESIPALKAYLTSPKKPLGLDHGCALSKKNRQPKPRMPRRLSGCPTACPGRFSQIR